MKGSHEKQFYHGLGPSAVGQAARMPNDFCTERESGLYPEGV
jgi:hypothetical protein